MVKNLKIALPLILIAAFALGTHAQEHFKRGLEQISFVPKGQWIGGVSVSYSQSDFENYQFLIVENLNGDTYTFKVSPMVMFCFKDNLAAGGRLSYSRSRTRRLAGARSRHLLRRRQSIFHFPQLPRNRHVPKLHIAGEVNALRILQRG